MSDLGKGLLQKVRVKLTSLDFLISDEISLEVNHVWFSDKEKVIGSNIAHYEVSIADNKIRLELYFEEMVSMPLFIIS